MRQVIAGEAVSQRVVRPFVDASGDARCNELLVEILGRDAAFVLAHRQQPFAQVRLHRHESFLCGL